MLPTTTTTTVASLLLCCANYAQAVHSSVDLVYKTPSASDRINALPARAYAASAPSGVLPEVDIQGFWFANFTIGAANNRQMLIDTGSADVYVNTGEYKPSSKSKNLNKHFSITFDTTKPNGSGSETIKGDLYDDIVASNGLSVPNQELGKQTSPPKKAFPQDGLIGFSSMQVSAFGGRPWIHSLCAEKKIDQCRFGLAFNTNKTGTQAIGGIDTSKFTGTLSRAPTASEWRLFGDVAVNNKVFAKQQDIITDSGTTVVYGPLPVVRRIFKALGLQTSLSPGTTTYLRAFFPCDKPPVVGFGFPSIQDAASATGPVSKKSKIFNILGKPMAFKDNGNNNCTAALQGMESVDFPNLWIVGQAFFQGHYIDHDIEDETMAFADLI